MVVSAVRRFIIRVGLGITLVLLAFLVDESRTLGSASEQPDALLEYPYSTRVERTTRSGIDELSYHVEAKFPARDVIAWISEQLQRSNWQPLDYDFMNPKLDVPVRRWNQIRDIRTPDLCIYAWGGYWEDAANNVVMYGFRYHDPQCHPISVTDLEVIAAYLPAAVAKQLQKTPQQFESNR